VIPQSILVYRYWQEIRAGLVKAGIRMHHVVIHAERDELARRIESDTISTVARQWRLEHLGAYEDARSWHSREAEIIDTTGLDPRQVAGLIAADAGSRT
jgi:hypothetical protein